MTGKGRRVRGPIGREQGVFAWPSASAETVDAHSRDSDPRARQLAPPLLNLHRDHLRETSGSGSGLAHERAFHRQNHIGRRRYGLQIHITPGFSSAATSAHAQVSQDTGPPSPPSRVHTGSRTHSPTETPSRSISPRDTADTFHTQRRPSVSPVDVAGAVVAGARWVRPAKSTATARATRANTTTPGT